MSSKAPAKKTATKKASAPRTGAAAPSVARPARHGRSPLRRYEPESPEEAAFLEAYDPSKYPRSEVTVDMVLLTIRDGNLCVLLVRRDGYPYRGYWALPGGFVNPDESLEQAARRELVEETSLTHPDWHLEQLGTYGDPGRDPRARVISVAYLGLLPNLDTPQHGSDAADARFWPVADLREDGIRLAFDHNRILADALERAASKLEYTPLATAFCHDEFTLGELRRVFEAVWETHLDGPNFRRWVLGRPGFVVPTGAEIGGAGSKARRSDLYRAGDATLLHPPMVRPATRERLSVPTKQTTPQQAGRQTR